MQWKEQAKQAIHNGFVLIPLKYGQKTPLKSGWRTDHLTCKEIDTLPVCGFGIVCGMGDNPIYAFDLDVKDQKIANEFLSMYKLLYGEPITRVGNPPKVLIPFLGSNEGGKKRKSHVGKQGHMDLLGYGQYFVAYNIHPETGKEYIWSKPPHEIMNKNTLTLEEKNHLFDFGCGIIPKDELKKKEVQPCKTWANNNNRQYTNREITAFLSCFGEEFYNGSHDEWIPVVMAVHHETQGSPAGKELAKRWSKQGSTYDEENFNYKWDTFDCEEDGDTTKKRSTFASLFYHHRKLIPDGLLEDRFSDAYNKAMFSVSKSGHFLYASDTKAWYKRDETNRYIWRITDAKIAGYIMDFLVAQKKDSFDICKELENEDGTKKNPRSLYLKAYAKRNACEQSRSKSTANALESKSQFHITSDFFDANFRYIGEKDGILDLETGQRITPTEELYITKSTGTPFVEGEPSQEFLDLVSGYFESEEVMNFFTRCVGMALLGGNKAHKIINLLGVGRSGKSTLIKLLQYAFEMQYIAHLQFKDIMSAYEGDAGTPNPSIISAFGSRIAVVNETNEYAPLNEAVVKAITGGDTIATRLLYSNTMIRKKASFTPFIVTNKPLFLRSTDDSIWERIVIIPFKKRVCVIDPTLEGRLKEYTLDAKKWFLKGVRDYINRGHQLDIPESCLKAVEEERYDLDTVQKWIDDYCELGEDFFEKSSTLTESYNSYLREEEKSRLSIKKGTLTKKLTQKGFITQRDNEGYGSNRRRITFVKGLKLKPAFESVDDNNNIIDFKR